MAADVTLVSIPDIVYEVGSFVFTAEEVIRVVNEEILFDDEWKVHLPDPDTGEDHGWYYMDGPGEDRAMFMNWFYDQFREGGFDSQEVGPWSPLKQGLGLEELYGGNFIPGPTAAMHFAFCKGRKLTPGVVSKAANLMSFPMGPTFYKGRDWRPCPGQRRRQVLRWMRQHMGEWVVTQSW